MAKSVSYNKKEVEKNKQQKRKEKLQRKEERRNNPVDSFEDMLAYVDVNGVILNTPPDLDKRKVVNVEDIDISTPKKEDLNEPELRGRVEFFNSDKGYGFIKLVGSTDKYFFHVSNAPTSISEGNMVTFELERGQKGMNAVRISVADKND